MSMPSHSRLARTRRFTRRPPELQAGRERAFEARAKRSDILWLCTAARCRGAYRWSFTRVNALGVRRVEFIVAPRGVYFFLRRFFFGCRKRERVLCWARGICSELSVEKQSGYFRGCFMGFAWVYDKDHFMFVKLFFAGKIEIFGEYNYKVAAKNAQN